MMGSDGSNDEPFFHWRSTHGLIDDLASLNPVTLYLGAGASVERTGLTWAGLSAQLLDSELGTYAERIGIVRALGPLSASSAIEQRFNVTRADNPRERLSQAIRDQLYSGPKTQGSYFNERVLATANDFIGNGKSVVIVTPNYDEFLLDAVESLMADKVAEFRSVRLFGFGVDASGNPTPDPNQIMVVEDKVAAAMREERTLCVVYLHGFVARSPDLKKNDLEYPLKNAYPVVSERDYSVTRENSQRILGLLFAERDLIILGSSLTDPPLVHSLITSREKNKAVRKRYVVRPLQGLDVRDLSEQALEGFHKVERDRASHLGVTLVSPPYYYQAPQILEETRVALALRRDSGVEYSDPTAMHRYGFRLNDWWNSWYYNGEDLVDRQKVAHEFLKDKALPVLRRILGAPADEDLRLEAWLRWAPNNRELRLWASSTGDWGDFATMRRDPISLLTSYTATRSFLSGAPTYSRGNSSQTRWNSFLAKPVRYLDQFYRANVPIGALCISSMKSQEQGSLNPKIKNNTSELFSYLDALGYLLFSTETQPFSDPNESQGPLPKLG